MHIQEKRLLNFLDFSGIERVMENREDEEETFLDLSGIGRLMGSGEDEDETRATRMDGVDYWDAKEDMAREPN
jgi:hypothetical protein